MCGAPDRLQDFARKEPNAMGSALDALTETLAAYARASLDEGASGIFYAPLSPQRTVV